MGNGQYQIDMNKITKRFGGVVALDQVSLQVKKGEIHALMGENGAGKSTIMKILAGAIEKDEGEIKIDGKPADIRTPKDGMDWGISIIYQELMLVPDLTVAENIFLDTLNRERKLIRSRQMNQEAQEYLDNIGFSAIRASAEVSTLSIAQQQVVEICKALSRKSSILILDEPTAVLSNQEVIFLFRLLRQLKESGVTIIYISHRLEEVLELCDRITILRDGTYIETIQAEDTTKKELANKMVGRNLQDYYPERHAKIGSVYFKVEGINRGRKVRNISFEVSRGEVLGINGLVGAGRTETIRAIFGEDRKESGRIYLDGREVNIQSPEDAVKNGIGLLPEDRKGQGVVLNIPIRHNITLGCLKQFRSTFGAISIKKESGYIDKMIRQLSIKVGSVDHVVSSLSGGNQQKVAIAKLLASDCRVMLLDEPTRGVDIGAKREIYKIINDMAEKGFCVILVSSEMGEIMGMCDRILIMRDGEIKGELSKEAYSEQNLIEYAMDVNGGTEDGRGKSEKEV